MAPKLNHIKSNKLENLLENINWRKKMSRYEIIVYWSETDNAYIAEVPELAGCMADGKTYIEAIQNAEIIIAEWIETAKSLGRTIPVPQGKLMYA
jgi:predicted RNase H-like HicB family nuclease